MVEFPKRQAAVLSGHNGPVHCITFSAGTGQYVLTGAADRTIRLFNPAKQQQQQQGGGNGGGSDPLVQTFSAHGYEVLDLSVASDNSRFASVGGDRQVFLWDVTTGQTLRRWTGHGARVNAVAFAGPGDAVVVSGSYDATVRLWDTRSGGGGGGGGGGKPIQILDEAKDSVTSLAVVSKGGRAEVVAGSADGRVRTYDLRMGALHTDCVGAPVTSISVAADAEAMLVSSLDSRIRLFDRGNGKCLQEYKGHENESYRIRSCFGLAGSVVLGGSEDGRIYVWDLVTGKVIEKLEGQHGQKVATAVSWNGRKTEWASAGSDGSALVWKS